MPDNTLELTSTIVSAFLGKNQTSATELTSLIGAVHKALLEAVDPAPEPAAAQTPAVTARRSVTPDAILCMDCGKPFKSLRRHLTTEHGLSPEAYRAKWDLPKTYPMVAPAYSAERSAMAKTIGLGSLGRAARAEAVAADVTAPALVVSQAADTPPAPKAKATARMPATPKPASDGAKLRRSQGRKAQ